MLTPFETNSNNNKNQVSNLNNVGQSSGGVVNVDGSNTISESLVEPSRFHGMTGLAWMTMHRTGSIKYQLR